MVRLNPRSLRVLDQDGAPDVMHSVEGADHVGAFLKEAREVTGKSVADVAQTLRIRRVYMEAIEDGRFDELPGATYAVGFVRSYATYLRLDVPEIVARFKSESQGIEADQHLDFPTPVPEGRFPGGALVTVCLLIAAVGFGGWYWWQDQNNIEVVRVPPPPEVLTGSSETAPDTIVTPKPAETAVVTTPDIATEEPPVNAVAAATQVADTDAPDSSVSDAPETPVAVVNSAEPVSRADAQPEVAAPVVAEAMTTAEVPTAAVASADVAETPEIPAPASESATEPETETPVAAAVTETPAASVTAEEAPSTPSTPAAQPTAPNSDLNVGVAVPVESSDTPASTQSASLPAIPTTPAASDAGSDARTYGTVNRDARIVVSAQEADTWVQVMDSQENALLTQMLRPGDKYLVPNRPGLRLRTNNAGGLDIQVDGASVPTIGGRGDVRHDVRLDPDLLKSGTAVVE